MSNDNSLALICHPDALPTMSPTISEILDRQQATLSQDRQSQEQRLQALELAVKALQEWVEPLIASNVQLLITHLVKTLR